MLYLNYLNTRKFRNFALNWKVQHVCFYFCTTEILIDLSFSFLCIVKIFRGIHAWVGFLKRQVPFATWREKRGRKELKVGYNLRQRIFFSCRKIQLFNKVRSLYPQYCLEITLTGKSAYYCKKWRALETESTLECEAIINWILVKLKTFFAFMEKDSCFKLPFSCLCSISCLRQL